MGPSGVVQDWGYPEFAFQFRGIYIYTPYRISIFKESRLCVAQYEFDTAKNWYRAIILMLTMEQIWINLMNSIVDEWTNSIVEDEEFSQGCHYLEWTCPEQWYVKSICSCQMVQHLLRKHDSDNSGTIGMREAGFACCTHIRQAPFDMMPSLFFKWCMCTVQWYWYWYCKENIRY